MKKIERVNIMCNDSITNSKCNCFAEILKGINILPDEESERKMYYLTNNILRSNGYRKYEISF